MSAIINAGENLMLDRQVSVAQTKTQGGRRLAQKRGPTLYNLEVEVPAQRLNGDTYYAIEEEVMTLQYGAQTLQGAGLTGKIGGDFTEVRGNWTDADIDGSSQNGTNLKIKNTVGTPEAFDYLQLRGTTKVYQVTSVANTGTNEFTIVLNSPIAGTVTDGDDIAVGSEVSFNFALMAIPQTSYQPGKIVQYGTFKFEEVIENGNRGN